MKYLLIIVFSLVFIDNAFSQKKKQLSKEAVPTTKNKVKEQKVVVTSINGRYMLEDTNKIKVFMVVDINNLKQGTTLSELNDIFKVQWSIQPETGLKEKLKSGKIEFSEDKFKVIDNLYYLVFEVTKPKEFISGILYIEFIDLLYSTKYTNDLPIDFSGKRIDTRFFVFENAESTFPILKPFISTGKPLVIKALKETNEKIFLKRYINKSSAALSPMSNTKKDPMSEYEANGVIEITAGKPFTLDTSGLYVLTQKVDFHEDGYGFLVVNARYPRLTYAEQLVEPLVYMSTPKEIESLKSNTEAKDALDLYFLTMCKGNQTLAKQIIKSYFKRVEEANKLFSNYKDGWKTDKGMVYVIMGPPSRVQRNRQREVWLYAQNQNSSEIIFTFYRKTNSFTDQNYELVRYPEYSSFWYPYVEAWRTGNVVE